jgi:pimeloyl-ACP methyl ester carboxylesterase
MAAACRAAGLEEAMKQASVKVRSVKCGSPFTQQPATREFTAAGETIAAICEEAGRDPVVFIHGNSCTKTAWLHQIAAVRRRGRAVLAPDLPGHGQSKDSPRPEHTYTFPGYAGVITALIDQLHWRAVDVVGWSLGGHIGLELLATDRRVRSLLIVGTPPVPLKPESIDAAFYPTDSLGLAGKPDYSDADAVAFGTAFMGGAQLLPLEFLNAVKRTDGRARQIMFASALRGVGADERQVVETIDKPLCVVHGENEPFVRLDYLRSLQYRALWRDRIHVISGAGHAPHWQCPESFNKLLLEFLETPHRRSTSRRRPQPPRKRKKRR